MRHENRGKRQVAQSVLGTTKGKILVMLCWKHQTVSELAEELGLTDNAVRAQLHRLARDGLVTKAGSRRGVRKPHVEYELTPDALKVFPRAYEPALVELVNVITDRLRANGSRALLVETGRRLLHRLLGEPPGGTLRQRVNGVVHQLNGSNLGIDVREESGKLMLRSCSCPIASVVAAHPEVCGLLASVMGEILGAGVSESCQKGESARCRFVVMD